MDKFIKELNERIDHLEKMVKEYPKSFYYDGCLCEAKYLKDALYMNLPKESEVEHA